MHIYIFGFDQAYAGVMVGVMDIFDQAKKLLAEQGRISDAKSMRIRLVSVDGEPILCQNNLLLNVHCSVKDILQADIFIVTSIHDVDAALSKNRFMVDWIRKFYQSGTIMASICTGAFLLAETGLLDGKEATTHWKMSNQFKKRYPKVHLKSEKLIINHCNLYCSGGRGSSSDLAYYLLEKYFGHQLASVTAKLFIHDLRRISQNIYTIYGAQKTHGDTQILNIQEWIDLNIHQPISIKDLSNIACMSPRTFERRFKNATGDAPSVYIQRIKVEVAKRQLESKNLSFEEISQNLGYMNSGSFRKIFVRWVGLLPSAYRQRFSSYH